jgi:hypothetical protein
MVMTAKLGQKTFVSHCRPSTTATPVRTAISKAGRAGESGPVSFYLAFSMRGGPWQLNGEALAIAARGKVQFLPRVAACHGSSPFR